MEEKKELSEVRSFLSEPLEYGKIFAESGIFPDIKSAAQGAIKVLAGKELGLSPMESMTNIFFVNNKRALTSGLMASLLKKQGKYDYKVDKLDNEECSLSFFQIIGDKKELLGKSEFSSKDAAKAGLANKENWKNYPRNCLFARALSNGIKWYAPDAVCGYVVEELDDISPTEVKTTTVSIGTTGEVTNGNKE